MKGMASAPDYYQAPPPGQYPATITLSEATLSKKGNTQIHITGTIDAPATARGATFDDYLQTDGAVRGIQQSKQKFRQLGIKEIDSDMEIDDNMIAQKLLGMRVLVQVSNEPQMAKPDFKVPQTTVDPKTGATVVIQKLRVEGYSLQGLNVPAQPAAQPQFQQPQMPQQQIQPPWAQPQMAAPHQIAQVPQQYVQPSPPAGQPPTGWPGLTAVAQQVPAQQALPMQPPPGGYAPPQQGWPPGIPNFATTQQVATAPQPGAPVPPPWANGQQAAADETAAKKRKVKVTDVPA